MRKGLGSRGFAGLAIALGLSTLGCARTAPGACGPEISHIDAATAIQRASAFALREPVMLEQMGYSADELTDVLRNPDCCRADKMSPDVGTAPAWRVEIHTQEVARPWEIVVTVDLCGAYREMNWIQLQRMAPVP